MRRFFVGVMTALLCVSPVRAAENEVVPPSPAKVFVREHPQTGKPFVSLRAGEDSKDLFRGFTKREVRPDYKMLDAKVRSGEIPYDGPVSDRKKVYIFAATMMTLGVAGGVVTAAMPVGAAAAGASGGTGLLGAGALATVGTTAGTVALKSHLSPGEENYIHEGKTTAVTQDPGQLRLSDVLREIDRERKTVI
ncbi:MAG: hypothetical protein KTQ49_02050 [Candidatus Omnitrophica bacterium]|nr:hypothetical protein [Candidatus Omnitrophota bacterium]